MKKKCLVHRARFPRWPPSVLSFPRWDLEGPPPPLLHTGIFWTSVCKDSLAMNCCITLFSALRGRFIDFSLYSEAFYVKKVEIAYLSRFRLVSALSHCGNPFSVASGGPAGLSHAGHLPWSFPTLGPGGTPHPLLPQLQTGRWFWDLPCPMVWSLFVRSFLKNIWTVSIIDCAQIVLGSRVFVNWLFLWVR